MSDWSSVGLKALMGIDGICLLSVSGKQYLNFTYTTELAKSEAVSCNCSVTSAIKKFLVAVRFIPCTHGTSRSVILEYQAAGTLTTVQASEAQVTLSVR